MPATVLGPQVKPIANPTSTEWNLAIKDTDYDSVLKGFKPQQMEDRWVCVADGPDAHGNTILHAARSWTSEEQVSLTIEAGKDDVGPKIGKLTWDISEYDSEQEAKELAVNICRHILGCELENA
ncbi:uncharacterized protein CC84DRAFT_1158831 [Paraphaeosphaeria sporulosa]|uniref:Uncharacterized protein n=1 Tax=Paraphaeosphaeria sporulosa TaxID=1460663 RepID=A0A177CUP4_9PLEO|nr:uncharacterized protein CC84DRAFT_1158831 [Paraphaeosphaeria sporulosa]OAG11264.1 hypothetical protein CC84DRAFT_1158831 [Paraphaeosphaeria sporulosa]